MAIGSRKRAKRPSVDEVIRQADSLQHAALLAVEAIEAREGGWPKICDDSSSFLGVILGMFSIQYMREGSAFYPYDGDPYRTILGPTQVFIRIARTNFWLARDGRVYIRRGSSLSNTFMAMPWDTFGFADRSVYERLMKWFQNPSY